MALWDPEAAGNAAIYLRLPKLQMIDIQNAPFEGKTAVWVPYSETGYCKVCFPSANHDLDVCLGFQNGRKRRQGRSQALG